MKEQRARTQEEFFAAMHRDLRAWNKDIPESPERLDPILRILMQMQAHQLATIDSRIDNLWQVATDALIKSLYPESKRWPVPAYTVMKCQPVDPVIEIDPDTRFYYRERREGGQTFYFSTQKTEKVIKASFRHILLASSTSAIDMSPDADGNFDTTASLPPGFDARYIYLGVDFDGDAADATGSTIFLDGNKDAMGMIRWSHWHPLTDSGEFDDAAGFCPGLEVTAERLIGSESDLNWGGLRSTADLFDHLVPKFAILPESFTAGWQRSEPTAALAELAEAADIAVDEEPLFWIRLDLPSRGDKSVLTRPWRLHFGTFICLNKNELSVFKHTGGNRLVEIEIQEDIGSILEITRVTDSNGKSYLPRHLVQRNPKAGSYTLEERDRRLVLWFDFTSMQEAPPESITVVYTVTGGVDANGIEAGAITELYENHPGIESVENVTPTTGAMPAKTEAQIIREVTSRLRSRDRALSFDDITRWSQTFDSRIRKAACRNGIERTDNGVRRCIIVTLTLAADEFFSPDEEQLLADRLRAFLKSRSPVNTRFKVEVA